MKSLKIVFASFLFANPLLLSAQKATEANRPQDVPLDFSKPENIVIFIVIPVVFIILYFVWRNTKKKDAQKLIEENNEKVQSVERTDNFKNRE